ncbi:MAG: glycosyltransferase family 4 protein, partial [Anaerolineae bacterium]
LIAGAKGAYTPQLQALIRSLPASQQAQVTVINDFQETEKPRLLAACDLFVLASGHESFGIAFAEAWGCKKPVIGARVDAVSSLIAEGKDGLLFTYEDPTSLVEAILTLLANPQARQEMGRAGYQKVLGNYTWEIVTNRLRQVYVEAIARRRADRRL